VADNVCSSGYYVLTQAETRKTEILHRAKAASSCCKVGLNSSRKLFLISSVMAGKLMLLESWELVLVMSVFRSSDKTESEMDGF